MIFIALLFRAVGVAVCLIGTPLNIKERLFCIIAYLPKATVQAAIGSVPLSLGLPCGSIVLSVAVLGVIFLPAAKVILRRWRSDIIFTLALAKRISLGGKPNMCRYIRYYHL